MKNNDILKKLRVALKLTDQEILEILKLVNFEIGKGALGDFFRKEDHPKYVEAGDQVVRNFLNGLIIHKRGVRPERNTSDQGAKSTGARPSGKRDFSRGGEASNNRRDYPRGGESRPPRRDSSRSSEGSNSRRDYPREGESRPPRREFTRGGEENNSRRDYPRDGDSRPARRDFSRDGRSNSGSRSYGNSDGKAPYKKRNNY